MSGAAEWREILREAEELTPKAVDEILARHGSRGRKAIEAVGEGRVKRYNDFTIVVGWGGEYIVEGHSCNCPDMEYNLDTDDPEALCWHILAVLIAEPLNRVDEHDQWYGEVSDILE